MHAPPISRRTVAQGSLWAVPVLTVAAASPALAASGITVPSVTLPVAYVGETVSQPLSAIGGTAPYTWSTTGGQTAPGTALTSSGTVAGTPATAGKFTSTALAKDTAGSTGSGQVTQVVGANRSDTVDKILALLNQRRASLGLPAFVVTTRLSDMATNWADHLATTGEQISQASHQDVGALGINNENLSMNCIQTLNNDTTTLASQLAEGIMPQSPGWLNEKHGYAEYKALRDAGNSAAADDMFYGKGAYAADGESGHRISIEDPNNTTIGLATALSAAAPCGATFPYSYYAVAEFA